MKAIERSAVASEPSYSPCCEGSRSAHTVVHRMAKWSAPEVFRGLTVRVLACGGDQALMTWRPQTRSKVSSVVPVSQHSPTSRDESPMRSRPGVQIRGRRAEDQH